MTHPRVSARSSASPQRSQPPPLSAFAGGRVDGGRIFVDTINGRLPFGSLPPAGPALRPAVAVPMTVASVAAVATPGIKPTFSSELGCSWSRGLARSSPSSRRTPGSTRHYLVAAIIVLGLAGPGTRSWYERIEAVPVERSSVQQEEWCPGAGEVHVSIITSPVSNHCSTSFSSLLTPDGTPGSRAHRTTSRLPRSTWRPLGDHQAGRRAWSRTVSASGSSPCVRPRPYRGDTDPGATPCPRKPSCAS